MKLHGARRGWGTTLTICAVASVLRIAALPVSGDHELAFEWAALVPAMLEGQGYTYYSVSEEGKVVAEPPPLTTARAPRF